jgi:hypothetical protein
MRANLDQCGPERDRQQQHQRRLGRRPVAFKDPPKMKALICNGPGKTALEDRPKPSVTAKVIISA